MERFTPGFPFSIKYPTADLESGLFVKATIYDITTGSPVAAGTVVMPEILNGYYAGNFLGLSGKSYLVISLVYVDPGYSTIDTNRAPESGIYKSIDAPVSFSAFDYGSFDQETNLFVAGNVYDITSGTPMLAAQVPMTHVLGGVYLGFFTGMNNHTYQVAKFVYNDGTYATVNSNFPAGSDSYQLAQSGSVNLFQAPTLTGQFVTGILKGQSLSARLVESQC